MRAQHIYTRPPHTQPELEPTPGHRLCKQTDQTLNDPAPRLGPYLERCPPSPVHPPLLPPRKMRQQAPPSTDRQVGPFRRSPTARAGPRCVSQHASSERGGLSDKKVKASQGKARQRTAEAKDSGGNGVGKDSPPVHLLVESSVGLRSGAQVLRHALPAELGGVAQSLVACDQAQRQQSAHLARCGLCAQPAAQQQGSSRGAARHSAATQAGPHNDAVRGKSHR